MLKKIRLIDGYKNGALCAEKINELIDAVNDLQNEKSNDERVGLIYGKQKSEIPEVAFDDPKNWIGKLCKFWDRDSDCCDYGILESFDGYFFYRQLKDVGTIICFQHCEPVNPDDEVIYKGE